jgi:phosphomannomutase
LAPKFGTSGLRGLASELDNGLCRRYTRAFLATMPASDRLFLGRDLRASSPRIAAAVASAAGAGRRVVDCGVLPTPALALAAMAAGAPSVMVTGSHIPADRNGLKFYSAAGEITKAEEAAITARAGHEADAEVAPGFEADPGAANTYARRYLDFFGPGALAGLRLGVWQHSTVARDLLAEVAAGLGAEVVTLDRSDHFVPVDTEAVDAATRARLAGWARQHRLDAILSADGDGDRPLLTDETGAMIPGDMLGALTAIALGADTVVTPVSSNTLIERTRAFALVRRTRIGSPFVIAGMEEMPPDARTVGFEANGGFLLGFDLDRGGRRMTRLLTRDSFLPIFAPLAHARAEATTLGSLVETLPARRTAADRLENVATERSLALVRRLTDDPAARAAFFDGFGREEGVNLTDGLRVTFADGLILHLRPSGNAPELRCYAEAETDERAERAMRETLSRARAAT